MVYVIKIKYGETLRRFTIENTGELSFPLLEYKIRKLFEISAEKQICVTYNDGDNDVITMADDQDLIDALVMQSLNPLRLHVTPIEPKSIPVAPVKFDETIPGSRPGPLVEANDIPFKQILKGLTAENLKQAYEPLLRGAASPRHFAELMEAFAKAVATQVSAAVKSPEVKSRPVAEVFYGASSEGAVTSAVAPLFSRPFLLDRSRSSCPSEVPSSQVKKEGTEASEAKSVTRVFHNGVQCDGCGMSPIAGSRFKSTKKYDYDLCPNCFKDAEDQADYNRIDRPLFRPRHFHPSGSGRMRCPALYEYKFPPGRSLSTSGPYCSRPAGRWGPTPLVNGAVNGGKLDSRFVEDVTITDGTEMAPGTRFTKVWRLRNSGKVPWAPQTKLVHVGGDELGSVFVVPLELPEHGLLPDDEVEAAVDLIAPEKPGRYVSHWRLASPAGPKFGHRVWVVIQVVVKENNSFHPVGSETALEYALEVLPEDDSRDTLLLAPATTQELRESFVKASHEAVALAGKITYPEVGIPVTTQESRDSFVKASHEALALAGKIAYPELGMTSSFVDITEPFSGVKMFDKEKEAVEEATEEHSPAAVDEVKEELPTENVVQEEVAAVERSELGGGFSMVEMPSNGGNQVESAPTKREEVEVFHGNKQEQKVGERENAEDVNNPELLSVKLEAMGFSDRKLNVELLVKNKLDLRRTLDDLFAAAEWDPILEELEEMGFYDTEMNRRLMFKNNGSVKRVVKELVQLYKEPAENVKAKGVVIE